MKYLAYLWIWLCGLLTGKPHFVIGNPSDPYMLRWYKRQTIYRNAPSFAIRRTTDRHIVELFEDFDGGGSFPCWTIVLTGPKVRTWGFWCPKGFVPWNEFVDHTNTGNVGKGCGE